MFQKIFWEICALTTKKVVKEVETNQVALALPKNGLGSNDKGTIEKYIFKMLIV